MSIPPFGDPDCVDHDLERIADHPASEVDWAAPWSSQSYQVYRCRHCGDYWGCLHQYDVGTGRDDHWHRFGSVDPATIRRHY